MEGGRELRIGGKIHDGTHSRMIQVNSFGRASCTVTRLWLLYGSGKDRWNACSPIASPSFLPSSSSPSSPTSV